MVLIKKSCYLLTFIVLGGFRAYILCVLVYSVLVCTAHVVFQGYLLLYAAIEHEHYGEVIKSCNGELQ